MISARANIDLSKRIEIDAPDDTRIHRPFETPSVEVPRKISGRFRTPPATRVFTSRSTTSVLMMNCGQVLKQQQRTATAWPVYSSQPSSTRTSLRAHELKSSLNSLTASKIFQGAEVDESAYSTEEKDIEDYEKRTTVRPGQYSLLHCNRTPNDQEAHNRTSCKRAPRRIPPKDSLRN